MKSTYQTIRKLYLIGSLSLEDAPKRCWKIFEDGEELFSEKEKEIYNWATSWNGWSAMTLMVELGPEEVAKDCAKWEKLLAEDEYEKYIAWLKTASEEEIKKEAEPFCPLSPAYCDGAYKIENCSKCEFWKQAEIEAIGLRQAMWGETIIDKFKK